APVLPGDSLVASFDIEGLADDDSGRVRYSITIEVSNSAGRVLFRQEGRDQEATASLGGNRVPAFARMDVGLSQPPGEYVLKLTVTDRASGKTGTLTRKATLLPAGFGLVRLALSSDPDGQFPVASLGSGQSLWVNFGIVGFTRDGEGKQPNVSFQVVVRDEDGKPTVAKPLTGSVKSGVPDKAVWLPIHFLLSLNRPGKFTLELSATDELAGKTSKLSVPLVVRPED
ncbi:MAG: hypothetical protein JO244_14720, partial [Solirubrobacterales bacterium]|nr:hypothetical protein [Solirubrobacterales bacterium]